MTSDEFRALLERMTRAICAGDGAAAAACFPEQGIYHDAFYGEFAGRAEIAGMVCNFFHRDAPASPAFSSARRSWRRWGSATSAS
jgi:hypothetical protein